MSKAETNRAILRAFGDAARFLAERQPRPYLAVGAMMSWRTQADAERAAGSRRRSTYACAYAQALSTAFGPEFSL